MLNNKIQNPLKIFISSAMTMSKKGEKWRVDTMKIRKDLYDALSLRDFINVYELEHESSSIMNMEDYYLTNLDDSNMAIFIIDSANDISIGVLKEMKYAISHNIPRSYYIVPMNGVSPDGIREKLILLDGNNYINSVLSVDSAAYEIEVSVIKNIVLIYKSYFIKYKESNENSEVSLLLKSEDISLDKRKIENLDYTNSLTKEVVFGETSIDEDTEKPQSPIDKRLYELTSRMFRGVSLPRFWSDETYTAIESSYSDDELTDKLSLKLKIVKKRLKIIQNYFEGNHRESLEIIEDIHSNENLNALQSWFNQDILIDERTLLSINDFLSNRFGSADKAQQKLEADKKVLVYPSIDRWKLTFDRWVIQQEQSAITAKSSEIKSYGIGIYKYSNLITNILFEAMSNGSLTQLISVYQSVESMNVMMLFQLEDIETLINVLKSQLSVNPSFSNVNKIMRKYSNIMEQMSTKDAEDIMKFASSVPSEYQKLDSQCVALRLVGNYLSNEMFNKYWKEVSKKVEMWMNESLLVIRQANEILGMYRNLFRIPRKDIISFLCDLGEKAPRFYPEIFDIISGSLDYKKTTNQEKSKIIELLLSILNKQEGQFNERNEANALIAVIANWKSESKEIVQILIDENEKFYRNNIVPYVVKDDKAISFFTNKINEENRNQGKNGIYSYGINWWISAKMTLDNVNDLETSELVDIVEASLNTIFNEKQSVMNKISALRVIIKLASKFDIRSFLVSIEDTTRATRNNNVIDSTIPSELLEFIPLILKILTEEEIDNSDILLCLTMSNNQQYIKNLANILSDLIAYINKTGKDQDLLYPISQFLMENNSNNYELNTQGSIMNALVKLTKSKQFEKLACIQLTRLIIKGSSFVKRRMIFELKNEYQGNNTNEIQKLVNQLKRDSNFDISDTTNRVFS